MNKEEFFSKLLCRDSSNEKANSPRVKMQRAGDTKKDRKIRGKDNTKVYTPKYYVGGEQIFIYLVYCYKVCNLLTQGKLSKENHRNERPYTFFFPNCFAFSADLRNKNLVGSEFSCKPFLYYLPLATRPVIVVYNNTTML